MKAAFWKGLLHLFISSAFTGAASAVTSGAPIQSKTVVIPALVAGALAVGHAVVPSIIGLGSAPK